MPTERQRRAAERRRLRRQLHRRAQREARRRRFALIASIVGALVVIGIVVGVVVATGNDKSAPNAGGRSTPRSTSATSPASSTSSTSSTSSAPSYPCTWTKAGAAAKQATTPPTTRPAKTGLVNLFVQTSRGPMTFQLNRAVAPCTVESFVSLTQQQYYNSTPCHRLTTSGIYVLQCGDPLGNGSGGPGYSIPDEATGHESYPAGTIAMARTQSPHSGGSQFFIVYKDSPNLEQHLGKLQYTVFGRITSGLDVVKKVAAKGSDNSNGQGDGAPKLPITLNSLAVVE